MKKMFVFCLIIAWLAPARLVLAAAPSAAQPDDERVPVIKIIHDPLEPLNRSFHGFNNLFSYFFLSPFEKGYRFVFPEPVRKSIKKAGYNILFLDRLVNNLLQGKIVGAGVETGRFAINTTIGLLGFFDPATHWGLGNYDEDFGQTLGFYGIGQGFYFVIPIFGPSSLRDGLCRPLDSALDPSSYVFVDNFFELNELSFTLPIFERIDDMSLDPYAVDRNFWALERRAKVLDLSAEATPNKRAAQVYDPVPTLDSVFFKVQDPHFPDKGRKQSVLIPATGHKLDYSFWLKKNPAPLIFIVEGIGINRLDDSSLAMAELAWRHGFSVVTVSNPMDWEFIEQAGTPAVPGYTPVDAADLSSALEAIHQNLKRQYPNRVTKTGLVGVSHGALDALFVASLERTAGGFHPDRIVAIDPPVDLLHAVKAIDDYYRTLLNWPSSERKKRMELVLDRAITLAKAKYRADVKLPFTADESKFLIGYFYRTILLDVIFSSQKKQNLGVLRVPLGDWRRQPTYDALMQYSYIDYLDQFVLPYYLKREGRGVPRDEFIARAGLKAIEPDLKTNQKIRVFVDSDDFILAPGDVDWLRATLGERLTVFPNGGHLGNLHFTEVQEKIMRAFDGLK